SIQPIGETAADFRLTVTHRIDASEIGIELIDKNGLRVRHDERRVKFTALSGGTLLRFQGYMGGSDLIETVSGRAFIKAKIETTLELLIEVDGIDTRIEQLTAWVQE